MDGVKFNERILRSLSGALSEVPWQAWKRIVSTEPEYQHMQPLSKRWSEGPFLSLMTVAGLNDFQLKGKAEAAYWPPLAKFLTARPVPGSPEELANVLRPFYERERFSRMKVDRLNRFLSSDSANSVWTASAADVAVHLRAWWYKIASTMLQRPTDKTIAFAAKALAIGLLLVGNRDFDFSGIPVPVDLRVRRITPAVAAVDIQPFWEAVLNELRKIIPGLTMLHLDSLLWQYAGAIDPTMYLQQMGVRKAAAQTIVTTFDQLGRE